MRSEQRVIDLLSDIGRAPRMLRFPNAGVAQVENDELKGC
jgi:hypothetical protein